jgi:hypothetical protein
VTAREARRERLEQAAERLGELEQALDETRLELQRQLAENSVLTSRVSELQALLEHRNSQTAERKTLYGTVAQAVRTLDEMEKT